MVGKGYKKVAICVMSKCKMRAQPHLHLLLYMPPQKMKSAQLNYLGFILPVGGVLLIRPLAAQNNPSCLNANFNIQPDRIILDVIKIIFGVQMHWLVAAPVDLPPAGQTLRDGETLSLPGLIFLDQVRQFGTRTDQAHMAPQDVEELGHFVQAKAA